MMSSLFDLHFARVEAVNAAKDERATAIAEAELRGFRQCARHLRPGEHVLMLMDADERYIYQGIDRPMCCGVWLDKGASDDDSK